MRLARLYAERGRQFNAETLLHIAEALDVSLRIVWDEINALELRAHRQAKPVRTITASAPALLHSV